MIICFTGSHSTGKSTLVEFFKGKENFVSLDSCTRSTISAKERKVDGVEDLNETQLRMMDGVIARMKSIVDMETEDPTKIYCMDRSVIDFLSYTKAFRDKGLVSEEVWKQIKEGCEDLWTYINVFFYLPVEFSIVDDGVRSLDEDLRKAVDKNIREMLLWYPVQAVELSGSVLQRVKKVEEIIELLGGK